MASEKIKNLVQLLLENADGTNDINIMLGAFKEIIEYLDQNIEDQATLSALAQLSDDTKILIIQQFFRHVYQGSHQTEFDHHKVSILLAQWFDIHIDTYQQKKEDPGSSVSQKTLAGRIDNKQIYRIQFGETQIYFYLGEEHGAAAQALVKCIAENAILTTDTTSPPCVMAEFVPLWLKDRSYDPSKYYLDGSDNHHIAQYFAANVKSLQEHMGVIIEEPSTEMGIIANGDALRFHRDRLVNQYAYLEQLSEPRDAFSVAQSLTLIDWDMQANTLSGTIIDHPNGDRYLFSLSPGETASFFFTEPVKQFGPMMMPYHCALPVMDYSSSHTVGAAKGKRFSTVLRGIVKTETLSALAENSVQISINEVQTIDRNARIYTNGIKILKQKMPVLQECWGRVVYDQGEAISILEIPALDHQAFLFTVLGKVPNDARMFHIEKHGTGFSYLERAIPGFSTTEHVVLVNRSRHCPQKDYNYPLTLDFMECQLPWLQLLPMGVSEAVEIPKSVRTLAKLSPNNELIHRSALKDAFYQLAAANPRQVIAVDLILF